MNYLTDENGLCLIFKALLNRSMRTYSYGILLLCLGVIIESIFSEIVYLEKIVKLTINEQTIKSSKFLKEVQKKFKEALNIIIIE